MAECALQLTPADLHACLADGLSRPLSLTLTRNRVSLIRLTGRPDGGLNLRAQAALLTAPPAVIRALKRFLVSGRRSDWRAVCAFLQEAPRVSRPIPTSRLRTRGRVHDLAVLLEQVNAAHFPGPCSCRITWGREGRHRRRVRRQIAYGSYHREADLIRIHPLLDDPRVPEAFVAFIVYHERLHAALGAESAGGRQWHHTSVFRKMERRFPDYERMRALSASLLEVLGRENPS